jgi:flagellar motor switch protein FliN/FliY
MPTDLSTILKLSVPVIVRIGERSMPLEGILAMSPGAIIELNKPADAELELLINNKPVATGQAVKVGENFGLRIEKVGTARERVEAMGP